MSKSVSSILWTINITLAVLWIYQGLVPKIIFKVIEEQLFWQFTGINFLPIPRLIELSGFIEIAIGLLFLIFRQSKILHYFNIIGLVILAGAVLIIYPQYFGHAFNPFVMNVAMAMLSVVAIQLLNVENSK